MQRHAVHRRRHAVFAHPPMDIAPLAVVHVEYGHVRRFRVVRPRQIGRAAHGFAHDRVYRLQHHLRALPRGHLRPGLAGLLLHRADHRRQAPGHLAGEDPVELGPAAFGQFGQAGLPGLALGGAAGADRLPGGLDLGGDVERLRAPAIGGLGLGQLLRIGQRAVPLRGILRGVAQRDMRPAGDHAGAARGPGGGDRRVDGGRVMAVDFLHVPARRPEPRHLIGGIGQIHAPVDGDVVVVPQHDQPAQPLAPGQRDRLLADAFHQAAVAGDDPSVVVHHLAAEARAQHFLGHGKAHGVGDPLSQRAGGGLDAAGVAVFGVAGGAGAPLAEVADLVQRDVGVAGKIQQRIKQHRAMPGRQDEAVAVGPFGVGGVEFQVLFEQHGGHVGHAHGHAGMARAGRGHGVEGQGADGGRLGPVIGVCISQSGEIHGTSSLWLSGGDGGSIAVKGGSASTTRHGPARLPEEAGPSR